MNKLRRRDATTQATQATTLRFCPGCSGGSEKITQGWNRFSDQQCWGAGHFRPNQRPVSMLCHAVKVHISGAVRVHARNLQSQLQMCSVICRDLEDLKHVLLTNVVGTFAVTKAFLPLLKSGKKKTIINMSSDAGCLTQNASFIHDNRPSDAGMALSYRASKVAVNMGKLAPTES